MTTPTFLEGGRWSCTKSKKPILIYRFAKNEEIDACSIYSPSPRRG